MRRLTYAFLLLIAPLALNAQTAYLVSDINATTSAYPASSSPQAFFRFGSRVYFTASTTTGKELWSTDGTAAGTEQLKDIYPGAQSSNPSRFAIVNGALVFNATDSRGTELWFSDGTSEGTRLMADILPGGSSAPGERAVYHDKMIFTADDRVSGRELWITDGTPGGTRFFKDLEPGAQGSDAHSFIVFNDLVYFVAGDAIWKSDGTANGTVKVKSSLYARDLVVAGPRFFFVAHTDTTGAELWVSDGTESGTHIVLDIVPGSERSMLYYNSIAAFGDRVLFTPNTLQEGTELWISDGTAAGTHLLRNLTPGPSSSLYSVYPVIIGGTAFFTASSPETGTELWKTDGTEAGTTLVRDIIPGNESGAPAGLTLSGSRIYFAASSDGIRRLLWMTDGTPDGTHPVTTAQPLYDISPYSGSMLANADGTLYFAAANQLNGYEPWKSDGTDRGTAMIANLFRDSQPSSEPRNLIAADDWVYFEAWDGIGTVGPNGGFPKTLWRSDGTAAGTLKLTETPAGPYVAAGRSLLFEKNNNTLWRSDGTPESTAVATELSSRFPSRPGSLFAVDNLIFANVAGALWVTTLAPHAPATKISEATGDGFVEAAGRVFYFAPNEYDSHTGLWTTDGTPGGTYAVVPSFEDRPDSDIVVMGGHVYFTTWNSGSKLWKSDGTFEGTVVVKSLNKTISDLTPAGRNLFFIAADELWVTDGTEAGTRSLSAKPIEITYRVRLAAAGDRVIFKAEEAATGKELWGSDGTVEGTRLVRDIYPGANSSGFSDVFSAGHVAVLTAYDDVHGSEMWLTDGTPEGTRLAADIEPGINGSYPRQYVRAGDRLFFTALTTATGNELWAFPLFAGPHLSIDDTRITEGDSGTRNARFTVTLSVASAQSITVQFATSDAAALAGADYDAVAGTLTFAAGETSKYIDVPVRGDVTAESNETFFVTLRNATGASLARSLAVAVVEDDDQSADLALSVDFANIEQYSVSVQASNNGPRTATNIEYRVTATHSRERKCWPCLQQIAPGAKASVFTYGEYGFQQYLTMTATARQRDPQTADNSVGWTTNNSMAMDALYLTPGTEAKVWFDRFPAVTTVNIESSNPAVVSVPATMTMPADGKPVSFTARGVAIGTATIRVFTPSATLGTLAIDVVAPGTTPRWPGGLALYLSYGTPFDKPVNFRIEKSGTAPYSGATATGVVTASLNGQELARGSLTATGDVLELPFYLPDLGTYQVTLSYGGDANFLPTVSTEDVIILRGSATVTATAVRNGANATIYVRLTGSPMAAPGGTITIREPGVIAPVQATLGPYRPGISQAEITLSSVTPGVHTLIVEYSGDTRYYATTQNVRILDGRTRGVRH